ncbi:Short-chain dehydrogenase [Micromonospora echinaurantiaca]|uniref:Short-chain dehydrogenase n=1 Tax=Micromonospora echinaurantiaca TaxID=47857 RepID=A0A1C5HE73_9ACTN|nr:SDR family oxidoreductase [Micromonospora echinaurantiaca]SCG44280.1 Short-chain dehydrogenase [Micromonospora echinaurantiaca]
MAKTILITGAGSGFGEGAAIGLARAGHSVIATAQVAPQVSQLRRRAQDLGVQLRVEKLDLHDHYDLAYAHTWDIDILVNNAAIGECGPISEIPLDLVRRTFETNMFKPLLLTQGFVKRWVAEKKAGKIVFISSMGGLFTPPGYAAYTAAKHAIEGMAESLRQELTPFGIKVQTINPGAYFTGFNETMADTPFRWLDDSKNFTKRADLRALFDSLLETPSGKLDPAELIDAMVKIIPSGEGKYRNVIPQFVEDEVKKDQAEKWEARI